MRKYSHGRIQELIQPLMDMMKEDYPNNAELIITPDFAMINYKHSDMIFQSKKDVPKMDFNIKKCDCGGEAKIKIDFSQEAIENIENIEKLEFQFVCCDKCGKRTKNCETPQEAIDIWNSL